MRKLHAVFLAEFLDATGGVHDFLLAGVERVAFGTHFDVQVFAARGAGFKLVAATACYGDGAVVRMNVGFHSVVLKLGAVARKSAIIREIGLFFK
jgi:hypothetical protein